MTYTVLGIGAGNARGSAEILLHEALQAVATAPAVEVRWVRLDELHLTNGPGADGPDDADWLWEQLLAADGLVISAPIMTRTIPANLKLVVDRLLGPNADRAIVERMLELRRRGEEPVMAFRLDERVLKPRVAGLIAVGGSLTPQWKGLALPAMQLMTLSMQTAVVDQFVASGAGTPQSIVLDDEALARARRLGAHVASQLGLAFDEAEYAGAPGRCPMCHLDIVELHGRDVACATCGARGELTADFEIRWTDLSTSVISMAEKGDHFEEILETAARHDALRDTITERAAAYDALPPPVRPG